MKWKIISLIESLIVVGVMIGATYAARVLIGMSALLAGWLPSALYGVCGILVVWYFYRMIEGMRKSSSESEKSQRERQFDQLVGKSFNLTKPEVVMLWLGEDEKYTQKTDNDELGMVAELESLRDKAIGMIAYMEISDDKERDKCKGQLAFMMMYYNALYNRCLEKGYIVRKPYKE